MGYLFWDRKGYGDKYFYIKIKKNKNSRNKIKIDRIIIEKYVRSEYNIIGYKFLCIWVGF